MRRSTEKETRSSHSMRMKKDLDGFRRLDRMRPTYIGEGGRPQVAWRLRRAVTPWRIDRIRHARWRHDHGPSQTRSTWTARPRSRGRGLIRVHWLANRWRAPYRDWPRPRLPHDHAHMQWARVARPKLASTWESFIALQDVQPLRTDLSFYFCRIVRRVYVHSIIFFLSFSKLQVECLLFFFTKLSVFRANMDTNQAPLSPPASPQLKHVSGNELNIPPQVACRCPRNLNVLYEFL